MLSTEANSLMQTEHYASSPLSTQKAINSPLLAWLKEPPPRTESPAALGNNDNNLLSMLIKGRQADRHLLERSYLQACTPVPIPPHVAHKCTRDLAIPLNFVDSRITPSSNVPNATHSSQSELDNDSWFIPQRPNIFTTHFKQEWSDWSLTKPPSHKRLNKC